MPGPRHGSVKVRHVKELPPTIGKGAAAARRARKDDKGRSPTPVEPRAPAGVWAEPEPGVPKPRPRSRRQGARPARDSSRPKKAPTRLEQLEEALRALTKAEAPESAKEGVLEEIRAEKAERIKGVPIGAQLDRARAAATRAEAATTKAQAAMDAAVERYLQAQEDLEAVREQVIALEAQLKAELRAPKAPPGPELEALLGTVQASLDIVASLDSAGIPEEWRAMGRAMRAYSAKAAPGPETSDSSSEGSDSTRSDDEMDQDAAAAARPRGGATAEATAEEPGQTPDGPDTRANAAGSGRRATTAQEALEAAMQRVNAERAQPARAGGRSRSPRKDQSEDRARRAGAGASAE